jgi:hypothetical protein
MSSAAKSIDMTGPACVPRCKGHARHDSALGETPEDEDELESFLNFVASIPHLSTNLLYDGDDVTISSASMPTPFNRLSSTESCVQVPLRSSKYPAHAGIIPVAPIASRGAGYLYTPLSARSTKYESLRDDHGNRFRQRVPFHKRIFHWRLWFDEDAAPTRPRKRFMASVGRKKGRVRRWFVETAGSVETECIS